MGHVGFFSVKLGKIRGRGSELTYGPDCWSMSAPFCTRGEMAPVCLFRTATVRAGRSSSPRELGSAPWNRAEAKGAARTIQILQLQPCFRIMPVQVGKWSSFAQMLNTERGSKCVVLLSSENVCHLLA